MFELHRCKLYDAIAPDCAFLKGGSLHPLYRTDEEYEFYYEANFYYYTGCIEEDSLAVFDGTARVTHLFVPRRGDDYALWFGYAPYKADFEAKYPGMYIHFNDEFDSFIEQYSKRNFVVIWDIPQIANQENVPNRIGGLDAIAAEHRLIKDASEISLLTEACTIDSEAFVQVMSTFRHSMQEIEAEAIYKAFLRTKLSRKLSFECITGAGRFGNILHHHGTDYVPELTDSVLLDCGCLHQYYCADHTRVFPVGERFTPAQEQLYTVVLDVNKYAITLCKPGVRWPEIHLAALGKLLEGLRKLGIVKSENDFEEQMTAGVPSVFQPHGLGHLLGLDYHDVGGYTKKIVKNTEDVRLKYLRCGRVLAPGMVVTIEPGFYFIEAMLKRAAENPQISKHIDFEVLKQYQAYCGGFRIEDDVVITEHGCTVLPGPPKELLDIYELRRKAYSE